MDTNYYNSFITVATDCPVAAGDAPEKPDTIAGVTYRLLSEKPYAMTSDELLFEIHARRAELADDAAREAARPAFCAKSHACLRASPLAKRHGFGFHHDAEGRVAIYPLDSAEYQRLVSDPALKIVPAMRNKRA